MWCLGPLGPLLAPTSASLMICGKRRIGVRCGGSARNAPVPTEPIKTDEAKCEDAVRHLSRNGTFFSPTPIGAPGEGPQRMREFNLKIVNPRDVDPR